MGTPFLRLARGRTLRWAATVVLAVTAAAVAATSVQRAEAARAAYGELQRVPVATTDLAVGEPVTEAAVSWVELPVVAVPDGAVDAPVGRTVVEPVVAGEVLVGRRLSGDDGDADGSAALVGEGRMALAVPAATAPPGLEVGDRVEVYAPGGATGSLAEVARGQAAGARRLARDALVVAVDDDAVTIAVARDDATAVAGAVLDGAVVLGLLGAR